jgi:hypothetical protein
MLMVKILKGMTFLSKFPHPLQESQEVLQEEEENLNLLVEKAVLVVIQEKATQAEITEEKTILATNETDDRTFNSWKLETSQSLHTSTTEKPPW